jgi:hypothetical protein
MLQAYNAMITVLAIHQHHGRALGCAIFWDVDVSGISSLSLNAVERFFQVYSHKS